MVAWMMRIALPVYIVSIKLHSIALTNYLQRTLQFYYPATDDILPDLRAYSRCKNKDVLLDRDFERIKVKMLIYLIPSKETERNRA